jgi:hypothetical protein
MKWAFDECNPSVHMTLVSENSLPKSVRYTDPTEGMAVGNRRLTDAWKRPKIDTELDQVPG